MNQSLNTRILILAVMVGGCTVATDFDGDGVEDGRDACPGTRRGERIDPSGCSTLDGDGDGVLNDMDFCDSPPGEPVNSRGCPFVDTDGDGINDESDVCSGTAAGEPVNAAGCSTLDDDGDGVNNDMDFCDSSPAGEVVNSRGCEPVDTDRDGVDDETDVCPGTRSGEPVNVAGCSTLDDDGDGVDNDMDQCVSLPGEIVDGTGCLFDEGVGTLSGEWLINGFLADGVSCADAGIRDVRFNVDAVDGTDGASWTLPCENGLFDSRTAIDEPTISFNVRYTSFWEALDSSGAVIAMTSPLDLLLNNPPVHAIVATPDFIVDFADVLTIPLAWETDLSSGVFSDCVDAMVDRGITIEIYIAGRVTPFAEIIDGACGREVVIHSDDYPDFGPGSYEMDVRATAFDGTEWGASCDYIFEGGVVTAPTCFIPVIF